MDLFKRIVDSFLNPRSRLEKLHRSALETDPEGDANGDAPTRTYERSRAWARVSAAVLNPPLMMGTVIVLGMFLLALVGPLWAPKNPYIAGHGREGGLDIVLNMGEELIKGLSALFHRVTKDHLTEEKKRLVAALTVEHMLRPEQPDTFRAKIPRGRGVFRRIRIRSDTHLSVLVHYFHESLKVGIFSRIDHAQSTFVYISFGSI